MVGQVNNNLILCAMAELVGVVLGYCEFGCQIVGAVVQLVEYRTRNQEVAGLTHTRSTARNLEQVANLLCAQANSASYPQQNGK